MQDENRSVMHQNASQTDGIAKQPSFLTKDTVLFSKPSRGRNGSHVSASLPIQSLTPSAAGTTEFSAGNRAYSVPIVRASHPHVIEGET